eukprot:m.579061 g.579061  ORF g.579061 m.579061 type:complete len:1169 (-) comp57925_c0_seq4:576-4082(-)
MGDRGAVPGAIHLTLVINRAGGGGHVLSVNIYEVRGLRVGARDDIYVKLYLSGKGKDIASSKRKTVEHHGLNHEFNVKFDYPLSQKVNLVAENRLQASVWVHKVGNSTQIGCTSFSFEDIARNRGGNLEGWFQLYDEEMGRHQYRSVREPPVQTAPSKQDKEKEKEKEKKEKEEKKSKSKASAQRAQDDDDDDAPAVSVDKYGPKAGDPNSSAAASAGSTPQPTGPPRVTSLRPEEGSMAGGTLISIRGKNLGLNSADIREVTLCGVSCVESVQYESSTLIRIVSPPGSTKGPIIVTTKSGGVGACDTEFRYVDRDDDEDGGERLVDYLEESSFWCQEDSAPDERVTVEEVAPDPLKLNIRKLQLPKPSNPSKTDAAIAELKRKYPTASSSLMSEHFVAPWCLAELYQGVSFKQFKDGLKNLKKELQSNMSVTHSLIHTHASTYLASHAAVVLVFENFKRSRAQRGGDLTADMSAVVEDTIGLAHELFDPMLRRGQQSDKNRNVLNVMKSYKFLFNLPRSMKRNIKLGLFKQAIQDYKTAQTLFKDSRINVFTKILRDVESIAEQMKTSQYRQLESLQGNIEEQQKMIAYLKELDTGGDPGWFCVVKQRDFIQKQMDTCLSEYNAANAIYEPSPTEARKRRWTDIKISLLTINAFTYTDNAIVTRADVARQLMSLEGSVGDDVGKAQIDFVLSLSRIVLEYLSHLWNLGQAAIIDAKVAFKKRSVASQSVLQENLDDADDQAFEKPREQQVFDMLSMILSKYISAIRNAFMKGNLPNKHYLRYWLPKCERRLRNTFLVLDKVGLPEATMREFEEFAFEFQTFTIQTLFSKAVEEINHLEQTEDWHPVSSDARTNLPTNFEDILKSTFKSLTDVISIDNKICDVSVETLYCQCIDAFTTCMDTLAFQPEPDPDDPNAKNIPALEQRMVIVLSNCIYTRDTVIPALTQQYRRQCLSAAQLNVPLSKVYQDVLAALQDLDQRTFAGYVHQMGLMFGQLIQDSTEEFWAPIGQITNVRPFVMELLSQFVLIHSRVNSIAKQLVPRVISTLLAHVIKEFYTIVSTIRPQDNPKLALQLHLEVLVLQDIMLAFDSTPSGWEALIPFLSSQPVPQSKSRLPARTRTAQPATGGDETLRAAIAEFKVKTKFMFACLEGVHGSKHVMTALDKTVLSK